MSNTLTLSAGGTGGCSPDQDPWTPTHGADVTIINNSGSAQTLSDISNGCLVKSGQGSVTSIALAAAAGSSWTGKAGSAGANGTYVYNDGSNKRGMRTGTIDPS